MTTCLFNEGRTLMFISNAEWDRREAEHRKKLAALDLACREKWRLLSQVRAAGCPTGPELRFTTPCAPEDLQWVPL